MKKKNFILGASALLCLSALTPLALHATNNLTNFVQGESKDYSLAITPATLKINEAGNKGTIQTSLNNELALNLSRVSDKTDYLRLEAYGFISNDTFLSSRISGIQTITPEIEAADAGCYLTLYYGDEMGVLTAVRLEHKKTVALNGASYFRIESTGTNFIYKLAINYSCSASDTRFLTSGDTVTFSQAGFTVDTAEIGWRQHHLTTAENKLTISDFFPAGIDHFKVDDNGTTKRVQFYKATPVENGNIVHFKGESNTFKLAIPEGVSKAIRVTVNDVIVPETSYSIQNNQLILTYADANMAKVNAYLDDGNCYRYYVSSSTQEKRDEALVLNNFGATGFTKIDSVAKWKELFGGNGNALTEAQKNNFKPSGVYLLTADLDFGGEEIDPFGFETGKEDGTTFYGQIYGNGHTISNYSITKSASWFKGLFHSVEGRIFDLNLKSVTVSQTGGVAGALCASIGGSAVIDNVNVFASSIKQGDSSAELPGGCSIGGLSGQSWTDPTHCTFNGYDSRLFFERKGGK